MTWFLLPSLLTSYCSQMAEYSDHASIMSAECTQNGFPPGRRIKGKKRERILDRQKLQMFILRDELIFDN